MGWLIDTQIWGFETHSLQSCQDSIVSFQWLVAAPLRALEFAAMDHWNATEFLKSVTAGAFDGRLNAELANLCHDQLLDVARLLIKEHNPEQTESRDEGNA